MRPRYVVSVAHAGLPARLRRAAARAPHQAGGLLRIRGPITNLHRDAYPRQPMKQCEDNQMTKLRNAGGARHAARLSAIMRRVVAAAAFLGLTAAAAIAQTQPSARPSTTDDWKVSIYPIFAWVPLGIDIDVDVPPFEGGSGGSGEIVDGRFDGAFLGGFSAAKGLFRVDGDGLWAGVGGDRPERPFLRVDADVIYVHLTGGVKVVKDLYVIGGVRRLALKYNVALGELPEFERKPGVWDPLVGLGWHSYYNKLEVHATFEGGGFGVGTDVEYAGAFRLDWKPLSHFGLIGGYNYLYFKLSDDRANRTFTVKQTLHGPVVGIGFYF